MVDYEADTAFLGDWGRFQRQVFFLLCVTVVPNGYTGVAIVFVADTPAHRCALPAHANLTAAWRNSSIPLEEGESGALVPSKCRRYKLDDILAYSESGLMPGVDVNLTNVPEEGCLDGWEYDRSVYASTIITEWDLVCDNGWKNPLTTSIFFCGLLAGSIISGQLSDRYGRKIVLFANIALPTLCTLLQVFAQSWVVFCVLHFFVGMGHISNYVTAFVLGMETLSPRVRTIYATVGTNLFFVSGYMLLPLCAFFFRDWRMLLIVLSVPCFLYLPLWWFIPESPRWLLSQGRVEEAEAIVREAAHKNNIEPPPVIFNPSEKDSEPQKKTAYNICDLLKSRNIRRTSLMLWLVWTSLSVAYSGLSLNTANLHGNAYFNCFLSALVELPANFLSWALFRWCSRRLSVSSTLFTGGALLLFTQLIPTDQVALAIMFEMTGKFAVATAYSFVYAYTAELYPTVLRNTAFGACSMACRIGSITAPYFIYLRTYSTSLPYIFMGSITTVSALLSLLLPESYGMPLPDTIAHMQKFAGCVQKTPQTLTETDNEESPSSGFLNKERDLYPVSPHTSSKCSKAGYCVALRDTNQGS